MNNGIINHPDLFVRSFMGNSIDLKGITLGNVLFEPRHGKASNVVCATSKAPDQPAHTRSLLRAFGSRLSIL